MDDLKSLRDIISLSIDNIGDICEREGKPFPSLNDPVDPSELTAQGIRNDPAVSRSMGLIVAAASQLIATVQAPAITAAVSAYSYVMTSALGVVEAGNIPEILRDAGPNGLHLNEIAARGALDPKKLGRVLRYLATRHWFREISPNIFANNQLSSILDSGKVIAEGFDPITKYNNAEGMSAYIGVAADEFAKSGAYFVEALTDPKTKFSDEPNCTPFQKALDTSELFFEFYDRPTEQYRRNRFAVAMSSFNKSGMHTSEAILSGFEWDGLPEGSMVIDVGGGLGRVSMEIAKAHPKLQIVVEDRELVVKEAKQYWQENLPSHVSENKVHFVATNILEAQPELPGPVGAFLLRLVIHDWPDKYAIKILRHLRNAAGPQTKLIIIEPVIEHVCGSDRAVEKPPSPLLANTGGANLFAYSVDLAVFGVLNAGERTEEGFREILSASGWQLLEIRRDSSGPSHMLNLVSVPV